MTFLKFISEILPALVVIERMHDIEVLRVDRMNLNNNKYTDFIDYMRKSCKEGKCDNFRRVYANDTDLSIVFKDFIDEL